MRNKNLSCLLSAFIGIILGGIVGYFVFTTLIPGLVTALWIAFGISILSLILLVILSMHTHGKIGKCIHESGPCLAISTIGLIMVSIVGLAIDITTGVLFTAIVFGLGTLFLTMILLTILQFVLCLVDRRCECDKKYDYDKCGYNQDDYKE